MIKEVLVATNKINKAIIAEERVTSEMIMGLIVDLGHLVDGGVIVLNDTLPLDEFITTQRNAILAHKTILALESNVIPEEITDDSPGNGVPNEDALHCLYVLGESLDYIIPILEGMVNECMDIVIPRALTVPLSDSVYPNESTSVNDSVGYWHGNECSQEEPECTIDESYYSRKHILTVLSKWTHALPDDKEHLVSLSNMTTYMSYRTTIARMRTRVLGNESNWLSLDNALSLVDSLPDVIDVTLTTAQTSKLVMGRQIAVETLTTALEEALCKN